MLAREWQETQPAPAISQHLPTASTCNQPAPAISQHPSPLQQGGLLPNLEFRVQHGKKVILDALPYPTPGRKSRMHTLGRKSRRHTLLRGLWGLRGLRASGPRLRLHRQVTSTVCGQFSLTMIKRWRAKWEEGEGDKAVMMIIIQLLPHSMGLKTAESIEIGGIYRRHGF